MDQDNVSSSIWQVSDLINAKTLENWIGMSKTNWATSTPVFRGTPQLSSAIVGDVVDQSDRIDIREVPYIVSIAIRHVQERYSFLIDDPSNVLPAQFRNLSRTKAIRNIFHVGLHTIMLSGAVKRIQKMSDENLQRKEIWLMEPLPHEFWRPVSIHSRNKNVRLKISALEEDYALFNGLCEDLDFTKQQLAIECLMFGLLQIESDRWNVANADEFIDEIAPEALRFLIHVEKMAQKNGTERIRG